MIVMGILWMNFPPKSRDVKIGYKSPMSKKNDNTWRFAHAYISKVWLWIGMFLFVSRTIFTKFFNKANQRFGLILLIEIIVMILTIVVTEVALIRKFDREGKEKFDKKAKKK